MTFPNVPHRPTSRRSWLKESAAIAFVFMAPVGWRSGATKTHFDVRRNPGCGCCEKWVAHMRSAGFDVDIADDPHLADLKAKLGIPTELQTCHTAQGEGYVFEGHVPATSIQRFLRERPKAKGLAVAGMPAGSPGMESPTPVAYDVMAFDGTKTWVFEKITP